MAQQIAKFYVHLHDRTPELFNAETICFVSLFLSNMPMPIPSALLFIKLKKKNKLKQSEEQQRTYGELQ